MKRKRFISILFALCFFIVAVPAYAAKIRYSDLNEYRHIIQNEVLTSYEGRVFYAVDVDAQAVRIYVEAQDRDAVTNALKRYGIHMDMVIIEEQAKGRSSISLGELEDMVQAQMLLSQQSGLQEPYSGYYKTYVDYFGGTAFVDSKLTVYVTDTSPAAIQELAKYPGVNIKKVDYSLNQLNQLALQIVELGDAGKINGYGGPPAVLPRHNRVDLTIWTDRDQAQGGLSPSALLEALGVSSAMLNIVEVADYPQDATGAYILPHPGVPPKTGGASNWAGLGILAVAALFMGLGLYRLYRG